jgi:hypothetical protein
VCAQQEKPAHSSKKEAVEPVAPVKEGEPSTRQSEVRQPVRAHKDGAAAHAPATSLRERPSLPNLPKKLAQQSPSIEGLVRSRLDSS